MLATCSSTVHLLMSKSFPGAKSLDMIDFARPAMRDNPGHIIIHIGTNDARQSNPEDVTRNVENLCNQIKDQCPNTTISLS
jgi:lysophospholipase L1-like esterase